MRASSRCLRAVSIPLFDQYDGTTSSEEAGGYVKDPTNGCDINFMIIEKSAVIQFEKHVAAQDHHS